MAFFPEFLYKLSERDQQVTWLDPLIRRVDTALAAAVVNATFVIPEGRVLLLQHAVVSAIPGAAQNIIEMNVQTLINAQIGISLNFDDTNEAAVFNKALTWQGSLLLPPNTSINGVVTFNAGVAVNTVFLGLIGLLLPIGNVQRV